MWSPFCPCSLNLRFIIPLSTSLGGASLVTNFTEKVKFYLHAWLWAFVPSFRFGGALPSPQRRISLCSLAITVASFKQMHMEPCCSLSKDLSLTSAKFPLPRSWSFLLLPPGVTSPVPLAA